jgi:hypothetical protein
MGQNNPPSPRFRGEGWGGGRTLLDLHRCNFRTMIITRDYYVGLRIQLLIAAFFFAGCSSHSTPTSKVDHPVTFEGGHDIGANDYGRPVVLIAAALGVEPEVFREAFSGVTPAHGRGPTGDEARANKEALLKVLSPHGVTNERLDEVSDYYRFRPRADELWPTHPAEAHAVVVDGKITKIVVTDPGSGYCSAPVATVEGFPNARFEVTLGFSRDLEQNGTVAAVAVLP